MRLYVMILYTSVYSSVYHALPRQNELFRFFDSSFLEAPRVVPFYATATHCHHGMDFNDQYTRRLQNLIPADVSKNVLTVHNATVVYTDQSL